MTYKRICCPKCEESFGQETRFVAHLYEIHNTTNPLDLYLEIYHEGTQPTCNCSEQCQEKLAWAGWKKGFLSKYVRGHNARLDSVYLNPDKQKEMAKKRSEGYASGQYHAWNKGLTKESSDKVSEISNLISKTLQDGYASGRLTDWRKKSPEKASELAHKMSETKNSSYSLLKSSDSIKKNYEVNPDPAAKRYKPEQVISIVENVGKFDLLDNPTSSYRNKYKKLRLKCKTCGQIQLKNMMMLSTVCFSCCPKASKGQLEVYDFVRSLSPDAVLSDRSLISPKEIDILIPSAKLAIEYNSLYWHSISNISDKNYHEFKRKSIEATGHKFFMIFEDEWRDRRSVVEGMLRHRLGVPGEVFDARKLRLEKLDNKTAEAFFEASHLEGHARSSSCLGLVDSSGRVLAAMSIRRPFHTSRAETSLEVARSACLPGVTIRGWIGRLTSASLKAAKSEGIQSLVSYVDARVGAGKSYLSTGWTLESVPRGPRFWWTDYHQRFNRFKYKANAALGLSQADIAAAAGVVEIWGCGNYVVKLS